MNRLTTCAIAVALIAATGPSEGDNPRATEGVGRQAARSELLVRFVADTSRAAMDAVANEVGASRVEQRYAPGHILLRLPEQKSQTTKRVAEALRRLPQVEAVSENRYGSGGYMPNDTRYSDQWHLEQPDGADVDAPEAWDVARGEESVTVAVIDSGVAMDHPELEGRFAANAGERLNGSDDDGNGLVDDVVGWDFVESDNNPGDEHGHGTWVTSVLGANAGDEFGVAGVDHRARILPLRILNEDNIGTLADLVDAIYYAIDRDADVLNLSLVDFPNDPILSDALNAADGAGVIIVACAGNDGIGTADEIYPGAHPATMSVGATDENDQLAGFSSTGSSVTVTAPGVSIVAADSVRPFESNQVSVLNGCSVAAPIVSGVIGLMHSLDPQISRADAEGFIGATAIDLGAEGKDPGFGWGRIDAAGALALAERESVVFSTGFER